MTMAKFEHVFAAECEEIAARHEKQGKYGTVAPTNKHARLRQRVKTSPRESSQREDARRPKPALWMQPVIIAQKPSFG